MRPGELATIYIMMIVACAIPSWGFAMNLIPLMAGFFYYATPENSWSELIHPHLREWMVVKDPNAVWNLFEGAGREESVAWAIWSPPLLSWCLLAVTIYFVTLCILVVLRRQWLERERLLFPLATLPLELCQQDGKSFSPHLAQPGHLDRLCNPLWHQYHQRTQRLL